MAENALQVHYCIHTSSLSQLHIIWSMWTGDGWRFDKDLMLIQDWMASLALLPKVTGGNDKRKQRAGLYLEARQGMLSFHTQWLNPFTEYYCIWNLLAEESQRTYLQFSRLNLNPWNKIECFNKSKLHLYINLQFNSS